MPQAIDPTDKYQVAAAEAAGVYAFGHPIRDAPDDYADPVGNYAADSCAKCGADLDDGECEECERSAPLDFDR